MLTVTFSYVYLVFIVPLAILPVLVLSLIRYRYFDAALRLFTAYLVVNGLTNLVAGLLATYKINNLPLLHLYTLIEFLLISFFYRAVFAVNGRLRKIITVVMILYTCFSVWNSLLLQSIFIYNSYSRSLSSILIAIYAVLLFAKTLDDPDILPGTRRTLLFINTGFIIYFGCSFFLFVASNVIHDNQLMNKVLWDTHATLVLIMYLFFTKAILYAKHNS